MIARVLTIAGSDPSGGAGIQADLKTFTVFGAYGMSVLTALTAQNTKEVSGVFAVAPEFVRAQIRAVLGDITADAAKTGMLANAEIVGVVAEAAREYRLERLVVDPVLVAQSGGRLLEENAIAALREELLPRATILTPNTLEAAELLGISVDSVADMREAARRLRGLGARTVLVKGGHLAHGSESVDVMDDGEGQHELRAPRVRTPHTHGTGCMLSAAIAVGLAEGLTPIDAARRAKRFITRAIRAGLAIGSGNGPANPLAWKGTSKKRG